MTVRSWLVGISFVFIVTAGLTLRLRFVDLPLNRDEGEYAYGAQLLLQGVPPYTRLYSMRLPGIYAAYAVILATFGATHTGVHAGLIVVTAVTTVLIFELGRRLFGAAAGLAASGVHALVASDGVLRAFAAYSEHFVVTFVLGGLILLLVAIDRRHCGSAAAAGILFGCAVTMKQPGIFFVAFAVAWTVYATWQAGRPWIIGTILLLGGTALPILIMLAWIARTGAWDAFVFWTMTYAHQYMSGGSVAIALGSLRETVWPFARTSAGPMLLSAVGLLALWWAPTGRPRQRFIIGLMIASLAAVSPGLYLRSQYLILVLPVVSLLAGVGTIALARRFSTSAFGATAIASVLLTLALGTSIWSQRAFIFQGDPHLLARDAYHGNPFPEAIAIGEYLRSHVPPGTPVAVLGSEPEIYFYAQRPSATAYVYMYPLMEDQPYAGLMQAELIRDLDRERPSHLVVVSVSYSWQMQPKSARAILAWLDHARRTTFERVGIIDIVAREHTEYRWGTDAIGYVPRSSFWVEIMRRREAVGAGAGP